MLYEVEELSQRRYDIQNFQGAQRLPITETQRSTFCQRLAITLGSHVTYLMVPRLPTAAQSAPSIYCVSLATLASGAVNGRVAQVLHCLKQEQACSRYALEFPGILV